MESTFQPTTVLAGAAVLILMELGGEERWPSAKASIFGSTTVFGCRSILQPMACPGYCGMRNPFSAQLHEARPSATGRLLLRGSTEAALRTFCNRGIWAASR